jgi:AcrR family transcriptional regulator
MKKAPSAINRRGAPKRNQAGRPTLAELERRKVVVLEVATDLFVTNGYAQTSLVDIAKRAGVATRTLYQHFGDKEAIFREVIYARHAAHLIPSAGGAEDLPLFDTLMSAANMALAYVLAEETLSLTRLMVAESLRFPDLMARVANTIMTRFSENVAEVFQRVAARGLTPDLDPAESARLFLDLLIGNVTLRNFTGWERTRPSQALVEKKVDLFILGRFGPAAAKKARLKPRAPVRRKVEALSG